jgi:hypothetical protein
MGEVPDESHGRLSLIQAEHRKLESLRSMNVPWVFAEPTQITFAQKGLRPDASALDEAGLSFLRQSKNPFTSEDLDIVSHSMQAQPLEAPKHSSDFGEALTEVRRQQAQSLVAERNFDKPAGSADVTPDDSEALLSAREYRSGRLFDGPDEVGGEPEAPSASSSACEVEEAKVVIMDELERKHREQNPRMPVRPADPGGLAVPEGRRRLIDAVERTSDLTGQMDSVTFAKKKLERESALRRAALENCFGARHFRNYLESQHVAIPDSLTGIPGGRPRKPSKYRKDI